MESLPRCIVFGVSGSGKSTIGKLLAEHFSIPFLDADDFHPSDNIQKMRSGTALTDQDRLPWLKTINTILSSQQSAGWVLACSALKESYRQTLSSGFPEIHWILLDGSYQDIFVRLHHRQNHFMNPTLLQDQFDTLEIPEYGFKASIEYSPTEIVHQIIDKISE